MSLDKNFNIIFIHKGNEPYLLMVLNCAKKFNHNANIFLLGDSQLALPSFVNFYRINDYSTSAKNFANYYQHFSNNRYDFELFCIQRWFILRDFMKANEINNCFHADSDVLIFSDISTEREKFLDFSFTLSEECCGHNSFWNNYESLNKFCNFIEQIYKKNNLYQEILQKHKSAITENLFKNISDMTLFNLYKKNKLDKIGEMTDVINQSTYDHSFNLKKNGKCNFKQFFGYKKIEWKNELPYIKDQNNNLIKFNTIHLQGESKKYISYIYNKKKFFFSYTIYKNYFRKLFYLILKTLKIEKFYVKSRKKCIK